MAVVLAALAVCAAAPQDAKDIKETDDNKDSKESKDLKESKEVTQGKEFKPLPDGPDPRDISEDVLSLTNRTRRSGVIGLFNTKLHRKFALLGSLSSSDPHIPETGPDYGPPLSYDHKTFSLWGFKKAIFSTLLQAIKAITGGVIALKGQMIKVKGHLIAAKGHLLQTKGEAISDFGRHIATKALLSPPQVPPSATGLSAIGGSGGGAMGYAAVKPAYGLPSGPSYPSGPKPVYGPPLSGPSSGYGTPPAKPPPSAYGPPPSSPSAPSGSYGGPSSPDSTPPSQNYGAPPPPPLPSTSYGTPLGDGYNGPPPPSSAGSGSLYPPSSFPAGPSAPSSGYGAPFKRDIKLPHGLQAGLLVLKPLNVPTSALDPRLAPSHAARLRRQPSPAHPVTPSRHR